MNLPPRSQSLWSARPLARQQPVLAALEHIQGPIPLVSNHGQMDDGVEVQA